MLTLPRFRKQALLRAAAVIALFVLCNFLLVTSFTWWYTVGVYANHFEHKGERAPWTLFLGPWLLVGLAGVAVAAVGCIAKRFWVVPLWVFLATSYLFLGFIWNEPQSWQGIASAYLWLYACALFLAASGFFVARWIRMRPK